MALTLVTWNINSVRLRIDLVQRLAGELKPDVLCLQETKTPDEFFPRAAAEAIGFKHMLVHGMKGYNGVAVLSRLPLEKARSESWAGREDCRHGIAELPGGIELHNVYVPAGGDIPDAQENDKFAHKLRFLDELTGWFRGRRRAAKPTILVGDLNIAPLENDVWSHTQLLDVVSHTPIEVEKLRRAPSLGEIRRCRAPLHPARAKALHLVELSRARLGGIRPRPAARSCLGHAGAERPARWRRRPSYRARLAARLRPCSGAGPALRVTIHVTRYR